MSTCRSNKFSKWKGTLLDLLKSKRMVRTMHRIIYSWMVHYDKCSLYPQFFTLQSLSITIISSKNIVTILCRKRSMLSNYLCLITNLTVRSILSTRLISYFPSWFFHIISYFRCFGDSISLASSVDQRKEFEFSGQEKCWIFAEWCGWEDCRSWRHSHKIRMGKKCNGPESE